jgi:hypothetical protein
MSTGSDRYACVSATIDLERAFNVPPGSPDSFDVWSDRSAGTRRVASIGSREMPRRIDESAWSSVGAMEHDAPRQVGLDDLACVLAKFALLDPDGAQIGNDDPTSSEDWGGVGTFRCDEYW